MTITLETIIYIILAFVFGIVVSGAIFFALKSMGIF